MTHTSSSKSNSNHTKSVSNRAEGISGDRAGKRMDDRNEVDTEGNRAYGASKFNRNLKPGQEGSNRSESEWDCPEDSSEVERPLKKISDISLTLLKRQSYPQIRQQKYSKFNLRTKATIWALAVSMLPVLAIGVTTSFVSKSLEEKIIEATTEETINIAEKRRELEEQQQSLLIWTGITALLAGGVAVFLTSVAIRPVLKVAAAYTNMVNRLLKEEENVNGAGAIEKDEILALPTNISSIEEKLANLLKNQEIEIKSFQVLIKVSRHIWKSLSEEDIFRTTVKAARKALAVDRVSILRFDENGSGAFIEESIAPGWPKILGEQIDCACLGKKDLENYQQGRAIAINEIYRADLPESQRKLWQKFAVKAAAISPILINNRLLGLLIVNQCSESRIWEQAELELLSQLAAQVGLALECAVRMERLDIKAEQARTLIEVASRIRDSLNEEDILTSTVEEVRKVIRADRVIVYSLDSKWNGTVVAESVLPGFPKAFWNQIKDPHLEQNYEEVDKSSRVRAIDNIYEEDLKESSLKQLEAFAIKAYLSVPIVKDEQIFGLLIAHQCSAPRHWQEWEIDLFSQIALQVGFALDHARLLERVDAESKQSKVICEISHRIRSALKEQGVFKIAVEEIRKALRADRVILCNFDAERHGTVIAESVLPGFTKALSAQIKDPYFAEDYTEAYEPGKVQINNDIYEAGLSEHQIHQLERFGVKAEMVAPIMKDELLFGLLIVHQCSEPRTWQKAECELLSQLAMEVGYAIEHFRIKGRSEQTDLAIDVAFNQRLQQKQKKSFQYQISETIKNSKAAIEIFSNETQSWMELATSAYNQIQSLADSASDTATVVELVKNQEQQVNETVRDAHQSMNQIVEGNFAIREAIAEISKKLKHLDRSPQKLFELLEPLGAVTAQMKLQAMNAALKASRTQETEQDFSSVAEKFLSLAEQLEGNLTKVESLVAQLKSETEEINSAISNSNHRALAGTELVGETKEKLNQIAAASMKMNSLIEKIARFSAERSEVAAAASQSVLGIASLASHTTEQSALLAESLHKLESLSQEL